jgi:hypothetical protein
MSHFAGVASSTSTVSTGDNGPATSASFLQVIGVWVDTAGSVFMADASGCVVRKIPTTGNRIVTTILGTNFQISFLIFVYLFIVRNRCDCCCRGRVQWGGNLSAIGSTQLLVRQCCEQAICHGYQQQSSEAFGFDVRSVQLRLIYLYIFGDFDIKTATVITFAGNGNVTASGENMAATSAGINNPNSLWPDTYGNMFLTSLSNVRRVDAATGKIILSVGEHFCMQCIY